MTIVPTGINSGTLSLWPITASAAPMHTVSRRSRPRRLSIGGSEEALDYGRRFFHAAGGRRCDFRGDLLGVGDDDLARLGLAEAERLDRDVAANSDRRRLDGCLLRGLHSDG